MKKIILLSILCVIIASCAPRVFTPIPLTTAMATRANLSGNVPNFEHIVLIILENRNYRDVIGSQSMPYLNTMAQQNVLLSNYFAVSHPSLPNYIALVSGSTQNIQKNCTDCFIDQPNLADLIEASGRTWKTYQENMPSPCFIGNAKPYYQKHNPFIYFDSIRLNADRCQRSILPLTNLDGDLAANQLPSFAFIMPNVCNSGHDCSPETSDAWANTLLLKLQASPALGKNSLIIVAFDEADDKSTGSCCGLSSQAGGQVAAVLISPLAKPGFEDKTAYSHYSLLKTILTAWNLPELANTQLPDTLPIVAPWSIEPATPTK